MPLDDFPTDPPARRLAALRPDFREPPGARHLVDEEPLELEFGGTLARLEISYESWGDPARADGGTILICPSFSANSHANSHPRDPSPGWWEGMIGPGCPFDTRRFFVLCPSLLGGAHGTTGPRSLNPATGRPYGRDFPMISVRDVVAVHLRLLDRLGIGRLFAAVGGSMGAMEVLELAIHSPRRVARAIAFSGTDCTRPYTAAVRHLGRHAIRLGRMAGKPGEECEAALEGLRLAREMGTLFYRTRTEFNARFPWRPIRHPARGELFFDVQRYLDYQGLKAVGQFDLDSYLTLSQAMDLHDVWRGVDDRGAALEEVTAEFLIAGCDGDALIPIDEQQDVHHLLLGAGKKSSWLSITSDVGHDAFLVDLEQIDGPLRRFLASTGTPGGAGVERDA